MVFDASKIVFEYGAETGIIKPPWSDEGFVTPDVEGSLTIQSEIVRSGNKAVQFYLNPQGAPIDTRSQLSWWGLQHTGLNDLYFSMWTYLPIDYKINTWDVMLDHHFMVPREGGGAIGYDIRKASVGWFNNRPHLYVEWTDGEWRRLETPFPLGRWVHLQEHLNLHQTLGERQIWIDNNLVYEEINANTALTRQGEIATNISTAEFKLYVGAGETHAIYKYMDDFVVAIEKVPESYRVGTTQMPKLTVLSNPSGVPFNIRRL